MYRRVDWGNFFRKRSWIDWVITRNTDVKNEQKVSIWRDDAYISDFDALSLVRERKIFVWHQNPKCITASLWFKKRFINLIACLRCKRALRS